MTETAFWQKTDFWHKKLLFDKNSFLTKTAFWPKQFKKSKHLFDNKNSFWQKQLFDNNKKQQILNKKTAFWQKQHFTKTVFYQWPKMTKKRICFKKWLQIKTYPQKCPKNCFDKKWQTTWILPKWTKLCWKITASCY